jgi:uncharacterized membrane protein
MRQRSWIWFCSIPFWLLLLGAVGVAVTEDPAPVRFVATVAGGAAISGVLIGLVVLVGRSTARAARRTPSQAVQAQARAWTVIAAVSAIVTMAAATAAAAGGGGGAVVLAATAAGCTVGAVVAVLRRRI